MIQDDARVGKIAREPPGFFELCPRRLQVEAELVPREVSESGAPAFVAHLPRLRLVPDAAHEFEFCQRLQRRLNIVVVQPGLRDRDGGKPARAPQLLDVAHLAHRIARIPFRLHVRGFRDLVRPSVGEVVGGQVRPAQRRVVAIAECDRRLVAQPRVVVDARVPKMLMRVDDRKRDGHGTQS